MASSATCKPSLTELTSMDTCGGGPAVLDIMHKTVSPDLGDVLVSIGWKMSLYRGATDTDKFTVTVEPGSTDCCA